MLLFAKTHKIKTGKLILFILSILCLIVAFHSLAISVHAETVEEDKAMGDGWQEEELDTYGAVPNPDAPAGTLAKGVDISHWDGSIDFTKLKDEVDFVIIRCGYGQNLTSQDDDYFLEYVKGCMENNIRFGIYLYSYATSTTMAKGEAAHTLRQLNTIKELGASVNLPVFYDLEDPKVAKISSSTKADIARTYCSTLEDAGYMTGIYANSYWWNNYLTDSYFTLVKKWVAQYNDTFTYKATADIWQCSETASINGINSKADLNYMLTDLFTENQPSLKTANKITASSVSKASISKVQSFYLKASVLGNAKLSYSSNNSNITVNSSGKVTVKANYTGSAVITIRSAATFAYNSASKQVIVKIVSSKVKLSSLRNRSSRKLIIKWVRNSAVTGYQIRYSRYKSFKSSSYVKITKNSTLTKTLKKMKKGSTYYVKIRSYTTISGKRYYSSWSKAKHIKIKK